MLKYVPLLVFIAVSTLASTSFADAETNRDGERTIPELKRKIAPPVVWKIDNLERIGGLKPIAIGTPRRIVTERGPALTFNGAGDGLFVSTHPLQGAKQFTVEVVFRPAVGGAVEQRFFHMQEEGSENRVLFETRLVGEDQWFLDTFVKSGDQERTLYAEKFPHPMGPWYHAALVVDGRQMRHYVNGKLEMSIPLDYAPQRPGKTSLGMRINEVFWYRGDIRAACFSHRVLAPANFHLRRETTRVPSSHLKTP